MTRTTRMTWPEADDEAGWAAAVAAGELRDCPPGLLVGALRALFRDGDRRLVHALIRDLLRSGAAVETSATVEVGDRILLGSTRGHVVRLFAGGFAFQFARLLPLERFDASFEP